MCVCTQRCVQHRWRPIFLQMSKTRGKNISSHNSNSYLLTVLISSARKMRKSDCCFRSSFFSVQATSRPLNIWWGGWFCTKNTIFVLEVRQKKWLSAASPNIRQRTILPSLSLEGLAQNPKFTSKSNFWLHLESNGKPGHTVGVPLGHQIWTNFEN